MKKHAAERLRDAMSDLQYARELIETLEQHADEAYDAVTNDDVLDDSNRDKLYEMLDDVATDIFGDLDTISETLHEAHYQVEMSTSALVQEG